MNELINTGFSFPKPHKNIIVTVEGCGYGGTLVPEDAIIKGSMLLMTNVKYVHAVSGYPKQRINPNCEIYWWTYPEAVIINCWRQLTYLSVPTTSIKSIRSSDEDILWLGLSEDEAMSVLEKKIKDKNEEIRLDNIKNYDDGLNFYSWHKAKHDAENEYRKLKGLAKLFTNEPKFILNYIKKHKGDECYSKLFNEELDKMGVVYV